MCQIKKTVQFPEFTTIPAEKSSNPLFDLFEEDIPDNEAYCHSLMNKLLTISYAKLPDFFSHHCQIVSNPIKWLNKFEKLIADNEELFITTANRGRMIKSYTIIESKRKEIEYENCKHNSAKRSLQYINAGCETRCFSFRETKNKVDELPGYTDKIVFLTKEKYDYEQSSIDFINPRLPDFGLQCQKEIGHIQHLHYLTNELSDEELQEKNAPLAFNKVKLNININQFVDVFYRMANEMFTNGKPNIEGSTGDLTI